MKRLLDRVLSRWYTPNERYADAVSVRSRIPEAMPEYIQLAQGVYWPVPTSQTATVRSLCS